MGLSLFASRQNALLFFGETFEKKLFNVKRAQFCYSRALVELEEVFFHVRGPSLFKNSSPRLADWFLHAKDRQQSWSRQDFSGRKVSAEKWFAVGICKSDQVEKVFQRICLLLVRGFKRLSTRERERGRQKLRWDHRRKEQSLWKNVETHTLGLVGREKEVAKEKSKPTPENFHSVISKIAFSVSSSFPRLYRTLSLRQCRKTRKKNV